METLTAKEVIAAKGTEFVMVFPKEEIHGSWDRQKCKAYIAQADINVGLTIRGESPDSSVKEDVDLYCLDAGSLQYRRAPDAYHIEFKAMLEHIASGTWIVSYENEPRGGDPMSCAF